jgi:predicted Rossmann fold nucleotide-binding protein DprA/Smf involved in DNA uptake
MHKSDVAKLLCSHLCKGNYEPYSTKEFHSIVDFFAKMNVSLEQLVELSKDELTTLILNEKSSTDNKIERLWSLLQRSGSIIIDYGELDKYGIGIVTIFDEKYPKQILDKLKEKSPILLYYCGNLDICLNSKFVGIVGSRNSNSNDEVFVNGWVNELKTVYGVVTGGARGVDTIASFAGIKNNLNVIEFLSSRMIDRIKIPEINEAIYNGNLLLLSETIPQARFDVGFAMSRNKYIYAIAEKTIVVQSDYKKDKSGKKSGGTWNGAIENLKGAYPNAYVWENPKYKANLELINEHNAHPLLEPNDINVVNKFIEETELNSEDVSIDLEKIDLLKISKVTIDEILLLEKHITSIKTIKDLKSLNGISNNVINEIVNNKDLLCGEDFIMYPNKQEIINKFVQIDPLNFKNKEKIVDAQNLVKENNSIYPILLLKIPGKEGKIIHDALFLQEIDFDS